jgi:hypothetical protein
VQSISQGRREREHASCIHAYRRGTGLTQALDDHARLFIDILETDIGGWHGRQQALTIHELRHLAQTSSCSSWASSKADRNEKTPATTATTRMASDKVKDSLS